MALASALKTLQCKRSGYPGRFYFEFLVYFLAFPLRKKVNFKVLLPFCLNSKNGNL